MKVKIIASCIVELPTDDAKGHSKEAVLNSLRDDDGYGAFSQLREAAAGNHEKYEFKIEVIEAFSSTPASPTKNEPGSATGTTTAGPKTTGPVPSVPVSTPSGPAKPGVQPTPTPPTQPPNQPQKPVESAEPSRTPSAPAGQAGHPTPPPVAPDKQG